MSSRKNNTKGNIQSKINIQRRVNPSPKELQEKSNHHYVKKDAKQSSCSNPCQSFVEKETTGVESSGKEDTQPLKKKDNTQFYLREAPRKKKTPWKYLVRKDLEKRFSNDAWSTGMREKMMVSSLKRQGIEFSKRFLKMIIIRKTLKSQIDQLRALFIWRWNTCKKLTRPLSLESNSPSIQPNEKRSVCWSSSHYSCNPTEFFFSTKNESKTKQQTKQAIKPKNTCSSPVSTDCSKKKKQDVHVPKCTSKGIQVNLYNETHVLEEKQKLESTLKQLYYRNQCLKEVIVKKDKIILQQTIALDHVSQQFASLQSKYNLMKKKEKQQINCQILVSRKIQPTLNLVKKPHPKNNKKNQQENHQGKQTTTLHDQKKSTEENVVVTDTQIQQQQTEKLVGVSQDDDKKKNYNIDMQLYDLNEKKWDNSKLKVDGSNKFDSPKDKNDLNDFEEKKNFLFKTKLEKKDQEGWMVPEISKLVSKDEKRNQEDQKVDLTSNCEINEVSQYPWTPLASIAEEEEAYVIPTKEFHPIKKRISSEKNSPFLVKRNSYDTHVRRYNNAREVVFLREVTSGNLDDFHVHSNASMEKSPELSEMLAKALHQLCPLSHAECQSAVGVMKSIDVKKDQKIITQGEMGEHLYIIESGSFGGFVDDNLVTTLKDGQGFGELALFYGGARKGTVCSLESGKIWSLARSTFRFLLAKRSQEKVTEIRKALYQVPLLQTLSSEEIDATAEVVSIEEIPAGTIIFSKGEPGQKFYMIKEGICSIDNVDIGSNTTLHPGDSFGESALLKDEPCAATVQAKTKVICMVLERKSFIEILGPLPDLLLNRQMQNTLRSVPFLQHLTNVEREKLIQECQLQVFSPGESIVTQGMEGKGFYILQSGEALVTQTNIRTSKTTQISHVIPPNYFGEKTLLQGEPSDVNVTAVTCVECSFINREAFTPFIEPLGDDHLRLNQLQLCLQKIPFLQNLQNDERKRVLKLFQPFIFKKGEIILKERNTSQNIYIVVKGSATATSTEKRVDPAVIKSKKVKKDNLVAQFKKEKKKEIVSYHVGDFFGEEGFFHNTPTPYEVVSSSDTTCYVLQRHLYNQENLLSRKNLENNQESFISSSTTTIPFVYPKEARLKKKDLTMKNMLEKELELMKIIGTGGFGYVRMAKHKSTGQIFAVKTLQKQHIVHMNQQENVMNERNILCSLDHPFIVKVVQTFKDQDTLSLVLEFLQGGDLLGLLDRSVGQIFPAKNALFYASCVVLALEELHKYNVAYRDIKPENIAIDSVGYVRLIDFGFAKVIDDRSYTLCGTPEYMPPEIILGKGHNKYADYWSLGVLLFDMLYGKSPFACKKSNDHMAIWKKIISGKFKFPPSVDVNADDCIKKLLQLDPRKRLGALKGGIQNIKLAAFFSAMNFEALLVKKIAPPWLPTVFHPDDSSYFFEYDEEIKIIPFLSNENEWEKDF